uniref:Uncharacterized protein n=1 Tax=Anopheles coluzzii TaxID=1518534 RepID=A0A8W7PGG9_ANOCL
MWTSRNRLKFRFSETIRLWKKVSRSNTTSWLSLSDRWASSGSSQNTSSGSTVSRLWLRSSRVSVRMSWNVLFRTSCSWLCDRSSHSSRSQPLKIKLFSESNQYGRGYSDEKSMSAASCTTVTPCRLVPCSGNEPLTPHNHDTGHDSTALPHYKRMLIIDTSTTIIVIK